MAAATLPEGQNPALPEGQGGRDMLDRMNGGRHAQLSEWCFGLFQPEPDARALDIGCGGGANVARLVGFCPQGHVTGVDYAPLSVEITSELNKQAIEQGRCSVLQGNVLQLPFPDDSFDFVTAFETVYFWPDVTKAFFEVRRVLAPGGRFVVCNEVDGSEPEHYRFVGTIGGMNVYTPRRLQEMLDAAGFEQVTCHIEPQERWLVVSAVKRQLQ